MSSTPILDDPGLSERIRSRDPEALTASQVTATAAPAMGASSTDLDYDAEHPDKSSVEAPFEGRSGLTADASLK